MTLNKKKLSRKKRRVYPKKENKNKREWKSFYFDGEFCNGHVETRKEWEILLKYYSKEKLLRARDINPKIYHLYGFGRRYKGKKTLEKFFKKWGVKV